MKIVSITSHDFQKMNLVGNKDHSDTYTCSVCGCTGKRPAFRDIVKMTESEAKKAAKCTYTKPEPIIVSTVGQKKRYKVLSSPWRRELPQDTIVISADGIWFEREDGIKLWPAGQDKQYDQTGVFKLFPNEIEAL